MFFEVAKSSANDMKYYNKKFKCMTREQKTRIQGDYNSSKARNLIIRFEKCSDSIADVECKSDS